jgi:hypothetical protein
MSTFSKLRQSGSTPAVEDATSLASTVISSAERLRVLAVTIVGVGALGRQIACLLAASGARFFQLIDPARLESTTALREGYGARDAHQARSRVDALHEKLWDLNPAVQVRTVESRWEPQHALGQAVFCCVDPLETRRTIWHSLDESCEFWGDVRIVGDEVSVWGVTDTVGRELYACELGAEALGDQPPHMPRPTPALVSFGAGLLVGQFEGWLAGRQVAPEVRLDLNALAVGGYPNQV